MRQLVRNRNRIFSPSQFAITKLQADSVVAAPLYTKNFPIPEVYDISSLLPGFNQTDLLVVFGWVPTVTAASPNLHTIFTMTNGTSAGDGIRVRVAGGSNAGDPIENGLNAIVADSGATTTSLKSEYGVAGNEMKVGALMLTTSGDVHLFMDDSYQSGVASSGEWPTGRTKISIGGQVPGLGNPMVGRVQFLDVYNQSFAIEQVFTMMAARQKGYLVATAGQSNVANWKSDESGYPTGRHGFLSNLVDITAVNSIGQVTFVDGAVGGSALFQANDSGNGYWLKNDGTKGQLLTSFFSTVDKFGIAPNFIIWDQGEKESNFIETAVEPFGTLTKDICKGGYQALFKAMREKYPHVEIFISKIGARTASTGNAVGTQAIAEIQAELIAETPWIHFGCERYDQTLDGSGIHYATYTAMGQRCAKNILRKLGFAVTGTLGPQMVSASRSGTALTITLVHDGGTDFTPTTGIEGFVYLDSNGDPVGLSSVVRASATTITATLASGVAGTLYYIYNNAETVNIANVVKDNTTDTLPLQRNKVSVA